MTSDRGQTEVLQDV